MGIGAAGAPAAGAAGARHTRRSTVKRNLHAGRRRNGGLGLSVFTEDELRTSISRPSRCSSAPACSSRTTRRSTSSPRAAASSIARRASCAYRPLWSRTPSAARRRRSPWPAARRDHDFVVESNRVGFTNFGEGIQVVDPRDGELREPTKGDVAAATRLIDALDEIDVLERPIGAHDVPQAVAPLHNAEAILSNTTKHMFIGPISGPLLKKIVQMAAAVVGGDDKLRGRPLVSFITCPVSPLKLVKDCCEIIMESARAGMAVNILSMAMAGGSSPVTLAGTLVTHNAEVLSGITLSQLTRRGAPVIYGSSTTAMDLRLAAASVGSPGAAP